MQLKQLWMNDCVNVKQFLLFITSLTSYSLSNFLLIFQKLQTKYLGFPICAEAIIYLLLHNLHDSALTK